MYMTKNTIKKASEESLNTQLLTSTKERIGVILAYGNALLTIIVALLNIIVEIPEIQENLSVFLYFYSFAIDKSYQI